MKFCTVGSELHSKVGGQKRPRHPMKCKITSLHFPAFQSACHVSIVSSTFFIATDTKEKGSNFPSCSSSGPEITKKYFHSMHAQKSPATIVKWILNQSKSNFSTKRKIFKGRKKEFSLSMGYISTFKTCIRTLQSNLHFLPSF